MLKLLRKFCTKSYESKRFKMTRSSILFVLVCQTFSLVESKTSFVKDQSLNAVFPPVNIKSVPGIPDGHLRPLGWQKKPDGKVREEKDMPSAHTFYLRYVKTSRTVVLRTAIQNAKVLNEWEEDANLTYNYGELNMTIDVKKQVKFTISSDKRKMQFKKFLLDYMYENWYLTNTVPHEMMADFPLPSIFSCGTFKDRLVEAELWMSSGGTNSLLHSHDDHNVHCVLFGRKDFILIESKHKDVFDFRETYPNSGAGYSPLDMEMINVFKYQKISKTPWTWATLMQGDCIFVPAGYLHHVRSYGRSVSFTVHFAPSVEFDSSDCSNAQVEDDKKKRKKKDPKKEKQEKEEKTIKPVLSLADVKFVWTYTNGSRHLSDTEMDPMSLRRNLLLLLKADDNLYIQKFEHFFTEALGEDHTDPSGKEVFRMLTPSKDRDYLSRNEIEKMSMSRLLQVAKIFNKIHTHDHDEL
ncbi:hypothetical protein CHS0354_023166 [Potamilus streckersoni]|uniref:JmjC domain-containing protein n=1 Tax=Potamilus streckersoni TaxID=2493646 RepID=A0AAE0RNI5_9BIVA|nr:hypothetical protein CHS0354_023166 [Potamilus streckersoni]